MCVALGTAALFAHSSTARSLAQKPRKGEVLYEKPSETSFVNAPGRTAVCFVDGRNEAKVALLEAIRSKKSEDRLIVVHFVDCEASPFFDFATSVVRTPEELGAIKERTYAEAKETTLQYKAILEAFKVTNVELILMRCVRPQSRAVRFVGEVGAEIVYVGTHNLGPIARTILGSFSHYVLHNTQGCVVIAREKSHDEGQKSKLFAAPDEALQALQSVVIRDATSPGFTRPRWDVNIRAKTSLVAPKSEEENGDDDDNDDIDGFILVGPSSLS